MAMRGGAERSPLAIALGSPLLFQTSVKIANYGGDFVALKYEVLPANRPETYQNTVYVWNSSVIPWGQPFMESDSVDSDNQSGSMTLTGLTISATVYVVGYAVGGKPEQVCSSAVLDAGGAVGPIASVSLGITAIATDSVTLRYSVLYGYLPATYGNWVGLWRGRASPYNAPVPLGTAPIDSDVTEGTVTIANVPIAIQTTYTAVYFMGDPGNQQTNTTAAAILTFDTSSTDAPEATSRVASPSTVHRRNTR